jgi:hypothetical protein
VTASAAVPVVSPAEGRAALRRLRLRGATLYACRQCRHRIRVVSAANLPAACPDCGRRWGEGIWRRLGQS